MFGNLTNGHSGYPIFPEEQQSQYDMSALPQLQLFGNFPVGCTLDNINVVGNEHAMASSRPMKRTREPRHVSKHQNLQMSLNNNFCQDNPNPVSTGLKLSYEEHEHNSSITSNNIKLEMDHQKELLDHYVKVQGENIAKGIKELNKKHTASLLNTLKKELAKKLIEKETQIINMNRRNTELGLKIKQIAMEAQSWHYKAKYNESIVNALKNDLQRVHTQKPVQIKEGYGDSEVDDAASFTNLNVFGNSNQKIYMKPLRCKVCNVKEVCVLLLPCRHLCVCNDCESLTENCPVCQATRVESVRVFMS